MVEPKNSLNQTKKKHSHSWTGLYATYPDLTLMGHRDQHVHQCFNCSAILVGEGEHCQKGRPHRVKR